MDGWFNFTNVFQMAFNPQTRWYWRSCLVEWDGFSRSSIESLKDKSCPTAWCVTRWGNLVQPMGVLKQASYSFPQVSTSIKMKFFSLKTFKRFGWPQWFQWVPSCHHVCNSWLIFRVCLGCMLGRKFHWGGSSSRWDFWLESQGVTGMWRRQLMGESSAVRFGRDPTKLVVQSWFNVCFKARYLLAVILLFTEGL